MTSRAAVLVLVLGVLLVSYASSLRAYVEQRRHVAALESSIASSRTDIEELKREKQRWHDPAYVVAQARARFAYGFPGETGYLVLDANGKPLDHQDSLSDHAGGRRADPQWWQTTLTSVDTAGNPPVEPKGQPAKKLSEPDQQGGG